MYEALLDSLLAVAIGVIAGLLLHPSLLLGRHR